MIVRDATPDDLPAILLLAVEMFYESPHYTQGGHTMDPESIYDTFLHLIFNPDGFLKVAVENNIIIGGYAGGIAKHWYSKDKYIYELGVFISKEHRNGSHGVKLVKDLISQLDKYDDVLEAVISTATGTQFDRVEKLYERCGLLKTGNVFYKSKKTIE